MNLGGKPCTHQAFTQRSLYREELFAHKAAFTRRSLYTEELVHKGVFNTEKSLHRAAFTRIFLHPWGSIQRVANQSFLLNYLNLSFFKQGILKLMESGQKNMRKSMFVFCVVGCGTRSLSRRVPCPLLKIVALPRAKNRALDRAVCHPPAFVLKSWSRSCSLLQLVSSTLKDIYIYIRRLFKYKMNEEF